MRVSGLRWCMMLPQLQIFSVWLWNVSTSCGHMMNIHRLVHYECVCVCVLLQWLKATDEARGNVIKRAQEGINQPNSSFAGMKVQNMPPSVSQVGVALFVFWHKAHKLLKSEAIYFSVQDAVFVYSATKESISKEIDHNAIQVINVKMFSRKLLGSGVYKKPHPSLCWSLAFAWSGIHCNDSWGFLH